MALARDSGFPLYYSIARLTALITGFDVDAGRFLSLLFGLGALIVCLRRGNTVGVMAAAILAVFPPHAFFSTEARAYSLCALLVAVGVIWLEPVGTRAARPVPSWEGGDVDPHPREYRAHAVRPYFGPYAVATVSFVLAAYTHSYGVLFFPLPFIVAVMWRRGVVQGFFASAIAAILFLPGFWLARMQPQEAISWMSEGSLADRVRLVAGTFLHLGFAGPYPRLIAPPPPAWMQILSLIAVTTVVVWGCWRSATARFYAVTIGVPIVALFAFALSGRTYYFPMRFESVLAVPFALLLAASLLAAPRRVRLVALTLMLVLGTVVCVAMIVEHSNRAPDPYRRVAQIAAQKTDPATTMVASGYAYLEVVNQGRSVVAFPREQADHPGWTRAYASEELQRERGQLPQRFVWIGTVPSPEAAMISGSFRWRELARDGPVVALEVRSGD